MDLEQAIRERVRFTLEEEIGGEIANLIADKYLSEYMVEDLVRYIDHFAVYTYKDEPELDSPSWKNWYDDAENLADHVEGFEETGELTTNPLKFDLNRPFYFLWGCHIHLHIPSENT